MKICAKCKIEQPEENFRFRNKAKGIRQPWCRPCAKIERKKQFESYKARGLQKKSNTKWYKNRTKWLWSLKNSPCKDCGVKYHPFIMDFDHRPECNKVEDVSQIRNYPKAIVLAEIEKCDLVCSNCHRARTLKRVWADWCDSNHDDPAHCSLPQAESPQ